MEGIYSFFDFIGYLLKYVFFAVVIVVFYILIKNWLKIKRRKNRKQRYQNYKLKKANRNSNEKS